MHICVYPLTQTVQEVHTEDDGEGQRDGGPGHEPSSKVKELRDVERELTKWEEKAI